MWFSHSISSPLSLFLSLSLSLFLVVFSQFGFYDDNETVVEMQHQNVSEDHTSDTQTQHCFSFLQWSNIFVLFSLSHLFIVSAHL